jgi:hypothetical protein
MSEAASPLEEAEPKLSMQEIMSRDPEELTRTERNAIVTALRKARFEFMQQEAASPPKGRKSKTPVTLADLGL